MIVEEDKLTSATRKTTTTTSSTTHPLASRNGQIQIRNGIFVLVGILQRDIAEFNGSSLRPIGRHRFIFKQARKQAERNLWIIR